VVELVMVEPAAVAGRAVVHFDTVVVLDRQVGAVAGTFHVSLSV